MIKVLLLFFGVQTVDYFSNWSIYLLISSPLDTTIPCLILNRQQLGAHFLCFLFTSQHNFISTNTILAATEGIKQPWSLNCRSCCSIYPHRREKMSSFIFALINSEGLLWSERERKGVGGSTQKMCANSFPQGLQQEKAPSTGTAHTWGDYIFYLSLLGSIFPANSRLGCNQPRKQPSLHVCVCECVLFLFVSMEIEPPLCFLA